MVDDDEDRVLLFINKFFPEETSFNKWISSSGRYERIQSESIWFYLSIGSFDPSRKHRFEFESPRLHSVALLTWGPVLHKNRIQSSAAISLTFNCFKSFKVTVG
jgi:hypothetical protein